MTYILKKKLNYNISELIEGLASVSLFFLYSFCTVYLQFEHLKTCYTVIKVVIVWNMKVRKYGLAHRVIVLWRMA